MKRGFEPVNIVFGILMGSADIIPGVSGGTVALILGIYGRLIDSVGSVASAAANAVRGRLADTRASLQEVEWGLVIPLGIGILTALVAGARVIEPLLEHYPVPLNALFFGLIAASIPIPWRQIEKPARSHFMVAVIAAVFAFALVGVPPRTITDPSLVFVFLAAMVAICAMILPGISGSFLLVVMGMYQATLAALNAFQIGYIAVFVAGAAVGLGGFSKILKYLLHHHHDITMSALVGLMVGSLRAIWPYQSETRALLLPPSIGSFAMVMAIGAVGFLIVFALTRLGMKAAQRQHEAGSGPR